MATEPSRDLIEMGGGDPRSRRTVVVVALVLAIGVAAGWVWSIHGADSERSGNQLRAMPGAVRPPAGTELQPLVSLNNIEDIQLTDGRVLIATIVSAPTMTLDAPTAIVQPIAGLTNAEATVTSTDVMDAFPNGTITPLPVLREGVQFAVVIVGMPRCGVQVSKGVQLDIQIEYKHVGTPGAAPIVGMAPIDIQTGANPEISKNACATS